MISMVYSLCQRICCSCAFQNISQIFKITIIDLQFALFADIIIRHRIFKGCKPVDL